MQKGKSIADSLSKAAKHLLVKYPAELSWFDLTCHVLDQKTLKLKQVRQDHIELMHLLSCVYLLVERCAEQTQNVSPQKYIPRWFSQMTECSVPQVLFPTRGCAYPGECLALLGPSGAGKSTMLDMMSLRKTDGKIDGQVSANPLAPRRSVTEVKPQNFMPVGLKTCVKPRSSFRAAVQSKICMHGRPTLRGTYAELDS